MKVKLRFLLAAGILTILFGTIYVAAQQTIRLGVNQVLEQTSDTAAANLQLGGTGYYTDEHKVDLARTPALFINTYANDGTPIAGNGYLHNKLPKLPLGVLRHAQPGKDHAVTWEPEAGIRIAIVVAVEDSQYIVSGQSLKPAEATIATVGWLVLTGWLVAQSLLVAGLAITRRAEK